MSQECARGDVNWLFEPLAAIGFLLLVVTSAALAEDQISGAMVYERVDFEGKFIKAHTRIFEIEEDEKNQKIAAFKIFSIGNHIANLKLKKSDGGITIGARAQNLLKLGNQNFVVFSAGYYKDRDLFEPSGFLKIDSTILSPIVNPVKDKILNEIICYQGARISFFQAPPVNAKNVIERQKAQGEYSNYSNCLQAGPAIVRDGQLVQYDLESGARILRRVLGRYYPRVFLGQTENGEVFFGVSTHLPLLDLGSVLKKPKSEGGMAAAELVGLQPSMGVVMYLNGEKAFQYGEVEQNLASVFSFDWK